MRIALALLLCIPFPLAAQNPPLQVVPQNGQIQFRLGDQSLVSYVHQDPTITRPFFANAQIPGVGRVTRNHPVEAGDASDHATFHPGFWLAFSDVNGLDTWRLKHKVIHSRFVEPPKIKGNRIDFTVRNHYLGKEQTETGLVDTTKFAIVVKPGSWWLLWDTKIGCDMAAVRFGDQEEMGLGVRVASNLAVAANKGGRLLDSDGRNGGPNIWGLTSDWCDFSGPLNGKWAGVTVIPHPTNVRKSWWHARDYGLLTANPFGKRSGGDTKLTVEAGDTLRMRFGILVHSSDTADTFSPASAHKEYLTLVK